MYLLVLPVHRLLIHAVPLDSAQIVPVEEESADEAKVGTTTFERTYSEANGKQRLGRAATPAKRATSGRHECVATANLGILHLRIIEAWRLMCYSRNGS